MSRTLLLLAPAAAVLSRAVTIERNQPYARELLRPYQLSVIGPFVDWYFNPSRGFHAQAALGLAVAAGMQPDRTEFHFRDPGFGAALVLGFGHEWWATTDWSVGALGRLTVAIVSDEDDAGMDWTRAVVASPGLLLSVTYH